MLLFIGFLVVPVLEIAIILQVGQVIGGWQTALLLLAMSAAGAWIVRHEGRRAWRALRAAVEGGRLPAREAADGGLVLIGGTLLLTPGFLTDALGLLLVLPPTRAFARGLLARWADRRAVAFGVPRGTFRGASRDPRGRPTGGDHDPRAPGWDGPVVPGEVVEHREGDEPGGG